jgi:hypothetical protein
MSTATAVAVGPTFVWLGMVLAISFLEAPLKFRAPGVTVQIGLGIGRVVFRALNTCELVLAALIVTSVLVGDPGRTATVGLLIAAGCLLAQLLLVRPRLAHRTRSVLAGGEVPRSRAHQAYVGLEMIKVVALLVGGIFLLG